RAKPLQNPINHQSIALISGHTARIGEPRPEKHNSKAQQLKTKWLFRNAPMENQEDQLNWREDQTA
ncbi:hypothetical protein, partial [Lentimonas sp. CC8]|uniref:hypothetical protein n=1 Tax=Lentimonas sp. CC8 TaxID=2676101 RepID=UPI001A7ED284